MRAFTAMWPDAAANDDVDARLAGVDLGGARPVARERRHLTLCFHGDTHADALVARLRAADLTAAAGLRLRCHGAGVFGSGRSAALWLGVEPDDPDGLAALVTAAGGDAGAHVAHLTVARGRDSLPDDLPTGPGPWWGPVAVDLVASGNPYRTVARVELPVRPPGTVGDR